MSPLTPSPPELMNTGARSVSGAPPTRVPAVPEPSPVAVAAPPGFAVIVIDQLFSRPESWNARSEMISDQVPLAFWLLNAVSDCSGRKVPANGAKPLAIDVAADESKTVLV